MYVTANDALLQQLEDKVLDVADLVQPEADVVYLDLPVHSNVGDLLIAKGTLAFFERTGLVVRARSSALGPNAASRITPRPRETIFLHGGGNFGDVYDRHQLFREAIVKRFPGNRVIGLPQSVHYSDREALSRTREAYRTHPDLTLLVRDRSSLDIVGNEITENVLLCPDMAHVLWRDLRAIALDGPEPKGHLALLRRDAERSGGELEDQDAVDWPDILGPRLVWRLKILTIHAHAGLPQGNSFWSNWTRASDAAIDMATKRVSAAQTVSTSRLHGLILSLLLGRSVLAGDNVYGKLCNYINCWISPALSRD